MKYRVREVSEQDESISEAKSIMGDKSTKKPRRPKHDWSGKRILLTGGTGSFGRRFSELMLARYKPAVLRVFSRDELKQMEMREHLGDTNILYFVGDVRDIDRLKRAMEGIDLVIHAAALKQVPACDYNPFEAVKTNINAPKTSSTPLSIPGSQKCLA